MESTELGFWTRMLLDVVLGVSGLTRGGVEVAFARNGLSPGIGIRS